nr:uncharacterized protein LOC117280093 [Nicotiana tomentosiformis]
MESVPDVKEFPEVFHADLPGMPPDRDIDFFINLVHATQSISIPLYCMTPIVLKILKEELQDFLDKDSLDRVFHLWLQAGKVFSKIGLRSGYHQDGRVIAYASRHVKIHEKNYHVHDLELEIIVHALKIWSHYLKGVSCAIYTNHQCLQIFVQARHVVVDALSRKAESMCSLAFILAVERTLAMDIQALAIGFVRLDISEPSRVLYCVVVQSSLL